MTILAVFSVSFASLFFEVLIARAFAITQWSHLAFMVISVALFGFSAGNVLIQIRKGKPLSVGLLSLATGFCIGAAWVLVNIIPFDSIQLPFIRIQLLYLVMVFLLLASPFFFAGTVSATGFAHGANRPGIIYAASMIGSAAGASAPILLLPHLGFGGCVFLAVVFPALPAVIVKGVKSRAAAAVTVLAAGALLLFPSLLEPKPSSYKELSRYLQHPDAAITSRKDSIGGRVETYTGSGFRSAPALSLNYTGVIPEQTGVFVDSGSPVALYSGKDKVEFDFALACVGAAAYALKPAPEKVLVHLESGGSAIAAAVASRAGDITVIDVLESRAAIVRQRYHDFGVSVLSGPGRAILENLTKKYDVIAVDHPGGSLPGLISANEEYLLTVESVLGFLRKLTPDGVLSISRYLQIPPSDSLKAFATVYTAMAKAGVKDPGSAICVIRNFNMYTILAGLEPFNSDGIKNLRAFSETLAFDLVFLPGLDPSEANRFSRRPEALYHDAIAKVYHDLETGRFEFTEGYLLDVSAARDDKPYFNRFIKWHRFRDLFQVTGGRAYTFYFTGEILILIVLVISIVLSVCIIVVPTLVRTKRTIGIRPAFVFALIGAGFMFFELAWIKRLTPVTGTQTAGFAAVLSCLLVTSGIGGRLSERIESRRLPLIAAGAAAAILLSGAGMYLIVPKAPALSFPFPWIVSLLPVAAPGLLLGMLLPMSMRRLCRSGAERIFGWALNGIMSVLASTAAAGIVLFSGIQALLWISAGLYAAAVGLTIVTRHTD